MLDPTKSWTPPPGIDPEVIDLCVALNAYPGVETFESCFGQGISPCWIWFSLQDTPISNRFDVLILLLQALRAVEGWRIRATDGVTDPTLVLESPEPTGRFYRDRIVVSTMAELVDSLKDLLGP